MTIKLICPKCRSSDYIYQKRCICFDKSRCGHGTEPWCSECNQPCIWEVEQKKCPHCGGKL